MSHYQVPTSHSIPQNLIPVHQYYADIDKNMIYQTQLLLRGLMIWGHNDTKAGSHGQKKNDTYTVKVMGMRGLRMENR